MIRDLERLAGDPRDDGAGAEGLDGAGRPIPDDDRDCGGGRAVEPDPGEPLERPNSIRAPIESPPARIEFPAPVPASQLGPGDTVDWVWQGYIALRHVTLLTGVAKGGKTTLLSHLLAALGAGGCLAGVVSPGRALIVAEESTALWARRRDDLGIGDHAEFLCRPFKGRPGRKNWFAFLEYLTGLIRERRFDLVVFDTIAGLLPVVSENDAAEMLGALGPLHALAEAGASVLLIHHPRKSNAAEGQAARGSGALTGFVDVVTELRRYDPTRSRDRRRVLTAFSRFDETPVEQVIELRPEGYATVGSKADAGRSDRWAAILELLPNGPPGLTADDVRGNWPAGGDVVKPGKRTIATDLAAGTKAGRWQSAGAGTKGDPRRFWRSSDSIRASTDSYGARIESGGLDGDPAESEPDGDPADLLPGGELLDADPVGDADGMRWATER